MSKAYIAGVEAWYKRAIVEVRSIEQNTIKGTVDGIEDTAERILEVARGIAPIDTGDLVISGKVVTKRNPQYLGGGSYDTSAVSTVVFGDTIKYAVIHENWLSPDYMYPTTPGTRPRFLKLAAAKVKSEGFLKQAISQWIDFYNRQDGHIQR